jgi:hypothetical protein
LRITLWQCRLLKKNPLLLSCRIFGSLQHKAPPKEVYSGGRKDDCHNKAFGRFALRLLVAME